MQQFVHICIHLYCLYSYNCITYLLLLIRYGVYYYADGQWEDLEAAEVRACIETYKAHKAYEVKVGHKILVSMCI